MEKAVVTVLIPTFNRKEKLLNTLQVLSNQTNKNFRILISDNCSNYSIEQEVISQFSKAFQGMITISHQRFNIGGVSNILGTLSLCDTDYGWLLGDDDYVQLDAIEKIYKAIDQYPDSCAFWFSIDKKINKNYVLGSIEELQDFLLSLNNSGDFIFCSNKVYRVKDICQHMEITYRFTYTRIPQCFPIIEILKKRRLVTIVGGMVLAEHSLFEGGAITWDVNKTVSGLRTLMDYPTGLEWKSHCQFVKSIMFSPKFVLQEYLKSNQIPWNYRNYLKNIYSSCYRYCFPLWKRAIIKTAFWTASNPMGYRVLKKITTDKQVGK